MGASLVMYIGGAIMCINMDATHAIKATLEKTGISQLKEKQEEALLTFLSGKDIFVSLPTGYGKSLIYGICLLFMIIIKVGIHKKIHDG